MGIASILLGILGIFTWPLPYLGFPINVVGLVLGITGYRRSKGGMAVAGTILCTLGLVLTMVNLSMGLLDLIMRTYFST